MNRIPAEIMGIEKELLTQETVIQSIRAVVFDLDGTLYPKSAVKKQMIFRLFFSIRKLKKYNDCRKRFSGRDFGDHESMKQAMLADLSRGHRFCSRDRVRRSWSRWLTKQYYPTLLAAVAKADARPGVVELLDHLKGNGLRLAVVSDYGFVRERLESLGFDSGKFDYLLGTEEIGAMKPAPRISRLIAERLSVAPEKTLVIGDRADTDQALASGSGMLFLGVTDKPDQPEKQGSWLSWDELSALLERLFP